MKKNSHEEWTDLLSDFLDGALDGESEASVEEHLASCSDCRAVLEELRDVVARAKQLGPRRPPRDLWPGIAAAIRAPLGANTTRVIALPTARTGRVEAPTSIVALTPGQLALAASILVMVSIAVTSWIGPGIAVRSAGAGPVNEAAGLTAVADLPEPPAGLSLELAALEEALREAAVDLDPETVRILETNLALIERAIGDSRLALAQDPGNEFLTEHLERVYQRKLNYLRDAVRVSEWAG